MYNERTVKLIESIKNEVDKPENKMRHVQALTIIVKTLDGERHLAIKFVSIDTDKQRDKVKALAAKYCESLQLFKESKTTMTYLI